MHEKKTYYVRVHARADPQCPQVLENMILFPKRLKFIKIAFRILKHYATKFLKLYCVILLVLVLDIYIYI